MVWAPGYDEMPMSLSSYNSKGTSSITVKPWGIGSSDLVRMRPGDIIGIRGPYGSSFSIKRCNALLVGGGTGLAPLMPLAKELMIAGSKVAIVIGARTKNDLLFEKLVRRIVGRENLFITTDDGSHGIKGYPTDIIQDLIRRMKIDKIYTCGPEIMMRKLHDLATDLGIKFEASLERSMKCGIGICGSCTIGSYLLCRDGPVLGKEEVANTLDEFGLLQRDPSGRYVKI
jgi:dihydroorotate dehydrogenase electron transfer subunit